MRLVKDPEPPKYEGIDLLCCSVEALIKRLEGVQGVEMLRPALVVADPPWSYTQAPGVASPELHYQVVTDAQIASVLSSAYRVAADRARMAVWSTWPKLMEFAGPGGAVAALDSWQWRYVSGGSWHKTGSGGVCYHWLGASEPVLVYVKGTGLAQKWGPLENAYTSSRTQHSEKPVEWMAGWIERWTEPGDLVLDLYAGLAPLARACLLTGRRYIGAEIDPDRHLQARQRLARFAGERGL